MNQLTPFLIENRGVRGFLVELTEGMAQLTSWRDYSEDVFQQLAHALVAAPILAADLSHHAKLNLQYQRMEKGPVTLLVAQATPQEGGGLHLRGMAKAQPTAAGDFQALLHGGTLGVLIEPTKGTERYQGIVELAGDNLAEALQIYFAQSEQLATRIRLGANRSRVAGLMVQRLPEKCSDDDWVHVHHLMQTVQPEEVASTEVLTLLGRVFAEDTVRVFTPRPIELACTCSHPQISAMLIGLGEEELKPVLTERGRVDVTCEYCGRNYGYTDIEVRALFAAIHDTGSGATVQ